MKEFCYSDDPFVIKFVVIDENIVADFDSEILIVVTVFKWLQLHFGIPRFVPILAATD